MTPLTRSRSRLTSDDGNRPLRNRLDFLIALMVVQIILSVALWIDRHPSRSADVSAKPSSRPQAAVEQSSVAKEEPAESKSVFESTPPPAESKPAPAVEPSGEDDELPAVRVQVLNGCGEAGVARQLQIWLAKRGMDVRDVGNADRRDYAETRILDRAGRSRDAKDLARMLDIPSDRVVKQAGAASASFDFTIIIGKDYKRLPFAR